MNELIYTSPPGLPIPHIEVRPPGDLIMCPTQSVQLASHLWHHQDRLGGWSTQILLELQDVLSTWPNEVAQLLWANVDANGNVYLRHDHNLIPYVLSGTYLPARGFLLYMLMNAHVRAIRGDFRIDAWEHVCKVWGFPDMPERVREALGGLPSRHAIYVGQQLLRIGPIQALRTSQGWCCNERDPVGWLPGLNSGAITFGALERVYCLNMETPIGRESAWRILKQTLQTS